MVRDVRRRAILPGMTHYYLAQTAIAATQHIEASFLGVAGKTLGIVILVLILIGFIPGLLIGLAIGRAMGKRSTRV